MSRSYEINIEVEDLDGDESELVRAVIDAIENLDIDVYGSTLFASGDTTLAGGTTTDDHANVIARAIWGEIKRPVTITVSWFYKDRDPDESQYLDESDFSEMFPALTQLAMAADEEGDD